MSPLYGPDGTPIRIGACAGRRCPPTGHQHYPDWAVAPTEQPGVHRPVLEVSASCLCGGHPRTMPLSALFELMARDR